MEARNGAGLVLIPGAAGPTLEASQEVYNRTIPIPESAQKQEAFEVCTIGLSITELLRGEEGPKKQPRPEDPIRSSDL